MDRPRLARYRAPMQPSPLLVFTPADRLTDAAGRPYFLWDSEMTLDAFRAALDDEDPAVRAYYLGKLMRQARPDDVFQFVNLNRVRADWSMVSPYLGKSREMWSFLLELWARHGAR
jgi:hypothetical protein